MAITVQSGRSKICGERQQPTTDLQRASFAGEFAMGGRKRPLTEGDIEFIKSRNSLHSFQIGLLVARAHELDMKSRHGFYTCSKDSAVKSKPA